jgi:hypothetical protein
MNPEDKSEETAFARGRDRCAYYEYGLPIESAERAPDSQSQHRSARRPSQQSDRAPLKPNGPKDVWGEQGQTDLHSAPHSKLPPRRDLTRKARQRSRSPAPDLPNVMLKQAIENAVGPEYDGDISVYTEELKRSIYHSIVKGRKRKGWDLLTEERSPIPLLPCKSM